MRSSAPASAAVATPWRRCPLPTKLHAIRQSGNVARPFSYSARFLILGTSSGAPNWHQPTQSSPSNTRAACAVPARPRASFRSRLGGTVPLLSSWNPIHQQPPKMPLLRSTSAAKAGEVDSSRALTAYADTTMEHNHLEWLDTGSTRDRERSSGPVLLLCQGWARFECVEDGACELPFEAADRFATAFAFGLLALEIRTRGWVHACLCDRDSVEGRVELAVAAAVESVPLHAS